MIAAISDIMVYVFPVLGSMLLCYGIYQVISESKTSTRKKLQDRLRGQSAKSPEKELQSILRRGAMDKGGFADAVIGKLSIVPKFQAMLDQADLPWSAASTLMNLTGVALLVMFGALILGFHPAVGAACAMGVFLLPVLVMNFLRKRRLNKLTNQLPDVFEMMSQSLRAGHSLPGSIQMIEEQMPRPISTEFGRVYHEQNLGVKVEDALLSMADRVESLDVRFFVTAVLIQRQTGGDLAQVLDNIAHVIRERIELQGLVRGLTAEGRLSGWVLFALPAVVFLGSMYMNRDYAMVLLEDPKGQILMMVAIGMQLMGIAMIRWIVNIKI